MDLHVFIFVSAILTISEERLIVSGSSRSISASVGGDVTLSCSVNSHIKPEEIEKVLWMKTDKGEPITVLLYQNSETLSESSDEQYRDRVEFFTNEIHRGNFSLRLKRVRTEDKGVYICQVFTGQLSANTTVILERLGFSGLHIMVLILCITACGFAVVILSLIYCRLNTGFSVKSSYEVPFGSSGVLPCFIDPHLIREGLKVEWSKSESTVCVYQDEDIRPEAQHQDYRDRANFFTEDIKHGNFSLLLNNLTAEDEGQYTCKVYTQQISVFSVSVTLTKSIIDPKLYLNYSCPLVVPLGGSVILSCLNNIPLPVERLEVEWRRSDSQTLIHLYQDEDVRPEAQHQDYHDRAHFFTEDIKHGNFSLLLKNMTAEDEGQYTCKVYTGQESGETVVEVQCGERLIVSGSNHSVSAYEGEDVTLSCSVNSDIKPEEIEEVSWKKRDKDEDILVLLYQDNMALPDASVEQFIDRVEFFTDEIHRGNFSLRLKRVRTEDKGVYICQVFARGLSANTTVILEQLGFSGLHIFLLLLCIAACGSAVIICCLIYCIDTSKCVQSLKISLVICPNICMFIAFIIWGVTEGSLKESFTCCALYILRPVTLFWAVPDLDDLQDSNKPWIKFSTISREFAALTVIVYSVLFTYTWKQTEQYTEKGNSIILGICFALLLLLCLCIFTGGCCGIKQTKIYILGGLLFTQCFFLLYAFTVPSPDLMDWTCVVFVAVLLILVVYEDKGHVSLHNGFVFIFGAVGIILLNTATLAAELILKKRNGERAVKDLRVIVFPSECAFILCWLFFSTCAGCCGTRSVRNTRLQRQRLPRYTPRSHDLNDLSAPARL